MGLHTDNLAMQKDPPKQEQAENHMSLPFCANPEPKDKTKRENSGNTCYNDPEILQKGYKVKGQVKSLCKSLTISNRTVAVTAIQCSLISNAAVREKFPW